jgi:hypothetical protein
VGIKRYFVDELKRVYQERIASAGRAEADAALEAEEIRTASNRRGDAKTPSSESPRRGPPPTRAVSRRVDKLIAFAERVSGLTSAKIALGARQRRIESEQGRRRTDASCCRRCGKVSGRAATGCRLMFRRQSALARRRARHRSITSRGEAYWTSSVG